MKQFYRILLAIAMLQLTGCGDDKKPVENTPASPIAVTVATTEGASNGNYITASGKVEAAQSANLSTRMMGYVNSVNVKVGDQVQKGQLLVAINNSDLQAKKAQAEAGVVQAQAGFDNAKKDYERFKALFAENSASQKELDNMTSRYEVAQAQLNAAKQMKNEVQAQFKYVNIMAPFAGVVTNKFVKEGDMANPGMPLVSVEAPSKLQVTAGVPESQIDQITAGMKVAVLVKSINKTVAGIVSEVSPSASNTGGQFLVKIDLNTEDENVLSGMYTTVQFPVTTAQKIATVYVPTNALVQRGQLTGIYTVSQKNTAILRWVRLGETFGDKVAVLSGLTAGETYILNAEGKLYNGVPLSPSSILPQGKEAQTHKTSIN